MSTGKSKKDDFVLCGCHGRGTTNHILKKRKSLDHRDVYRWVMECGISFVGADPPIARDGRKLCERCAVTERGKKYTRPGGDS